MARIKRGSAADVWSDRVRRWRESGLTSGQFAEREGLTRPQALSWWAWRLSKREPNKLSRGHDGPALRLVRLETEAVSTMGEEPVEIVTAQGVRVLVRSRSSESAMALALRVLGVRP